MTIPLRAIGPAPHPHRRIEAPYSLFLGTSLVLAVFGGFVLAIVIPLVLALERHIDGERLNALIRSHGQIQLVGFAALFAMGMASRLMPRFAGRPLTFASAVPAIAPLIAAGLAVRALGDAFASGATLDASTIAASLLVAAGSLVFAAIVIGTLARRDSRAEATGWFFVLAAAALVAHAALGVLVAVEVAQDGWTVRAVGYHQALTFIQQYGVLLMFISGVATRAVPTFTGHPRAELSGRAVAVLLSVAVALYVAVQLLAAHGERSATLARAQDAALLVIAFALAWVIWLTGVFRPSANRVAAASQTQFWFVRAASAWTLVAALIIAWYGVRAFAVGAYVAAYETDAIRHAITLGVITMMIVGMGMLIIPEFAARRLEHPDERVLVLAMLLALNVAVALRIWPPIRGIDWLGPDRWWPIAASGLLAEAVVLAFAAMFAQSWSELRRAPGGASAARS